MNLVCVLVFSILFICHAQPIKEGNDEAACIDCDKDLETVLRVKRSPDGYVIITERREEHHIYSYESTIIMEGNPTINEFVIDFGNGVKNVIKF